MDTNKWEQLNDLAMSYLEMRRRTGGLKEMVFRALFPEEASGQRHKDQMKRKAGIRRKLEQEIYSEKHLDL